MLDLPQYLFPSLSSVGKFWIYQLTEGLEMRKILTHRLRMQKNSQTRADILWIFTDFHRVMQVQNPSCKTARKFPQWCQSTGVADTKIFY